MTTKKTSATHRSTEVAAARKPSAYHRLDELLHTMRCIAQYEDALCELSHELKRDGGLSPGINEELRRVLDKVPSHEYVLDLDALRAALVEAQPSMKPVAKKLVASKSVVRKSAAGRSVSSRKKAPVAKKKTAKKAGRKSSR